MKDLFLNFAGLMILPFVMFLFVLLAPVLLLKMYVNYKKEK